MVNILKPGCFKLVIVNIMNNCPSHVTKIDHLASWQNRPCFCLRVCQSKTCILLKRACWWMKAIIFRVLITSQIHVGIQCSSDISKLSIPVLYACILRIRACQYTHIHACMSLRYAFPYVTLYEALLDKQDIFMGMKKGFKVKFAYC